MLKLHTTSQSTGRLNANVSRSLLTSSGNATLRVIDLNLEIGYVANDADYACRVSLDTIARIRTAEGIFAGNVLYPSEQWLVARLFKAVQDETRRSFMRISWNLLATNKAVLLLIEDLARLEDHASRFCSPSLLGRAGSVRRIMYPSFDDTQCRDLTLGLEMARFDVEVLFSSVQELFAVLDENGQRLAELEKWLAQPGTLIPGLRYTSGHVAELLVNRQYIRSAKKDNSVVQPLKALVRAQ
ncbi:uncharacterized protein B0H18DRAFT_402957 [Fomitopsis serialis]|uniref:uncharacterized protein n=1 Tax=Fomitopsis serialis TaxID=139415 RepID=UPI002007B8D5|nr:uncharacterized protein B0H18DRAFT_402957 [Neoantrodia serialis]KAH9924805.1 hypothetical protein B0H18DRAFT_402957 [Neoantrodia serialis]